MTSLLPAIFLLLPSLSSLTIAPANPWPSSYGDLSLSHFFGSSAFESSQFYSIDTKNYFQGSNNSQRLSYGLFGERRVLSGKPLAVGMLLRVSSTGNIEYFNIYRSIPGNSKFFEPIPIDLNPSLGTNYVQFFGTGFSNRDISLTQVSVKIGGSSYQPLFVGSTPNYLLDSINIGPLPASLAGAGAVDVVLKVDGKTANTVSLSFK